MFKWIRRLTTIAALTAMLVVVPQTSALAGQGSVADVRAATAKFHDVKVAMGAGYVHFLNCFDSAQGGMGQHYVNFDLLNGTLNANAPQAMVYEVEKNKLQLVAVEWITPIQDPSNLSEPAPTLLGQTFTRLDFLGVWALHAWLWRPNPTGMFKNFNPAVSMCPAGS